MIEVIADISKRADGNPGAIQCLVGLISRPAEELMGSIKIIQTLDELQIKGTDIYIFWNDLAGKDYTLMEKIARVVPGGILKVACGQQDRSGIEMIEPFITKAKIDKHANT